MNEERIRGLGESRSVTFWAARFGKDETPRISSLASGNPYEQLHIILSFPAATVQSSRG